MLKLIVSALNKSLRCLWWMDFRLHIVRSGIDCWNHLETMKMKFRRGESMEIALVAIRMRETILPGMLMCWYQIQNMNKTIFLFSIKLIKINEEDFCCCCFVSFDSPTQCHWWIDFRLLTQSHFFTNHRFIYFFSSSHAIFLFVVFSFL